MRSSDAEALIRWYDQVKRPLPWRENVDPYRVLVSEVMLQQTTVAAVVPKYERWMRRFPTVEALARAPIEEVLGYWSGLGYYQRARRLHATAQAVVQAGEFPYRYAALQELPGIGAYTAAAMASICFEQPVLAVDTNVVRTLFRYYALRAVPGDRTATKAIEAATEPVLRSVSPGEFNQALMELGARICSVTKAECSVCPLRRGCRGRRLTEGPEKLPLSKPRKEVKVTPGDAVVLTRTESGESLLLRGTSIGLLGDLYQPPMLFAEAEGEHARLCSRLTELCDFEALSPSAEFVYGISGRKLVLRCFGVSLGEEEARAVEEMVGTSQVARLWWSPLQEEPRPLSTLTRKILEKVRGSSQASPLSE